MNRLAMILLLCFKLSFSFAQTQQDSIDYYIKNLNWASITVSTTYVPKLLFDENSSKLIALKNDSLEAKLLKCIDYKHKSLAVHVILSRRHNVKASLSQAYKYKNSEIEGVRYAYNGLKWYYDLNNGKSTINDDALRYVKHYWQKKLK